MGTNEYINNLITKDSFRINKKGNVIHSRYAIKN